jgi:hypothetical protein
MSTGTEKSDPTQHSGREFTAKELALVREVVESCSGLSRTELARTVCELLGWKRAAGGLKAQECREFLERLEAAGALALPDKQPRRPVGSRTHVPVTALGERGRDLVGDVVDYAPIEVEAVGTADQRLLFRELVGRYHYLGHAVPFGAHLRYLVFASRPQRAVVGCIQFSSPAWRMAARDAWIGWEDDTRERNLQRVVNNSPGCGSRTWRAACCRWRSGASSGTGRDATRWSRCWWRRWWTRAATAGTAIWQRTGSVWGRPRGAGGWTESICVTAARSRPSGSTPW